MTRKYVRSLNKTQWTFAGKTVTERAHNVKKVIFELLGNICSKCGFTDVRALQIDHIHGGGKQEHLKLTRAGSGYTFYVYVLMHLHRYQLLCANCNWIKRFDNNEIKHAD